MNKCKVTFVFFIMQMGLGCLFSSDAQNTTKIRQLRISYHIFNDDGGYGNFQADSAEHIKFFSELTEWINRRMLNLDTLRPAMPSPYIKSIDTRLVVDTILFHNDSYAWNCSDSLDSEYMRTVYVDKNEWMNYQEKHQTLPIFLGDNYHIVGGHVSDIGSKRLIAMRGIYSMYQNIGFEKTIYEVGRNIFHEIGHALGLNHNFQGGASGEQCDQCEDNGCPQEGTSNNLMDYWPSYGGALSACQLEIINTHLNGQLGSIGDIVINDSCYSLPISDPVFISNHLQIQDTLYQRQDWIIEDGGVLEVSGILSVSHGLKIQIMPGGQLILNGGILTNLCGDLWQGIEIIGDKSGPLPIFSMSENAQIEHANTGLSVIGDADLRMNMATFFNCPVSIKLKNCQVDDNTLLGVSFISDGIFHRSEEGARLNEFISLTDSKLGVFNSIFINTDAYKTKAVSESGVGIYACDSDLESAGNSFQFLSIGINCLGLTSDHSTWVKNGQFEYCACSILSEQNSYMEVSQNVFNLGKLENTTVTGIAMVNPGWVLIKNNLFSSEYGGGGLVGIYREGSRGGTHLVENNSFEKLDWGIIQVPDLNEPAWPSELSGGLGLVVTINRYIDVPLEYAYLQNSGVGLAQTRYTFASVEESLTEAFEWPVGGLSVISDQDSIVLTKKLAHSESEIYPQHNFFINQVANRSDFIPRNDLSIEGILDIWNNSDFISPVGVSDVEIWMEIIQNFREKPHLLRESGSLSEYFTDPFALPWWAIEQIIDISAQADSFDQELAGYIVSLARSHFEDLDAYGHQYYRVLTDFQDIPEFSPYQIDLPTELFLPKVLSPKVPDEPSYRVYPNPATEALFVFPDPSVSFSPDRGFTFEIYSSKGQEVLRGNLESIDDLRIEIGQLGPGMYTICLRDVKSFYGAQKFIILQP